MRNPLLVPELRQFLADNDLDGVREFCASAHPAIIAEFLSGLSPREIWQILLVVEPQQRADVFSHFDEDLQWELADALDRRELADLISEMPPDDRVDLLKRMPEERREALLPAVAHAEREDIRRLSSYREGTAGAVMTSDYITLSPELTAAEAIARLRLEAPNKETIYYAYIVDAERRLVGFVSLKDLILAHPERRIEDLIHRDVIFARAEEDQEEAARKVQKYDLIALPVVNGNDAMVGIITHDDALDVITQEHTEDMEKLMAIAGSHEAGAYMRTSAWGHFRNRCGWVVILAVLGLVSGAIVQGFEHLLIQFAILATFMPMLADTGGNTGSQSATLVVRALAMREIGPRDVLPVLFKEARVALMLAVLLGALSFGRVFLMGGGATLPEGYPLAMIGLAVSIALGLQVLTATLIGALLPIAAARASLDPAVVASPALTTVVDITGLLIFFTTVKLVLGL